MAETLFTIGVVCLILAGVGLILTVFLFIKLRIPAVIAELTGKTAIDAIYRMRTESNLREHGGRSLQSILDGVDTGDSSQHPGKNGKSAKGNYSLPTEKKYNLARTETGLLRQRSGLLSNNAYETYTGKNSQYQVSATRNDADVSDRITERETAPMPLPPTKQNS